MISNMKCVRPPNPQMSNVATDAAGLFFAAAIPWYVFNYDSTYFISN